MGEPTLQQRLVKVLDARQPTIAAAEGSRVDDARLFRGLHDFTVASGGAENPHDLAELIVSHTCSLLDVESCHLVWYENRTGQLRFLAGHGPVSRTGQTMRPGEGAAGAAFLREEPLVVSDYQNWEHAVTWALDAGMKNALVVPLMLRGKAVGVLAVHSERSAPFTAGDVRALTLMAAQVAPALESSRLIVDLRAANSVLTEEAQSRVDFLNQLTHEIRTPLNAVLGFAQLLEGDEPIDSELHAQYLAHIRRGGAHLLSLVNDALDLAKVRAGGMAFAAEPFDFDGLVAETVESVEPLAHRADIEIVLPDVKVGQVIADRRAIHQVLLNLVGNAIKYSGTQGKVEVATASRGDDVLACVADTGPGIPLDEQERIFAPFTQVSGGDPARPGTGLGLTLAKRMLEAQGGRIWVQSEVGVGSEFWLELPRHPGPGERATA